MEEDDAVSSKSLGKHQGPLDLKLFVIPHVQFFPFPIIDDRFEVKLSVKKELVFDVFTFK